MIERHELVTIARALREALSYEGSREVKIDKLRRSPYIDVRALMMRLDAIKLVGEHSIFDRVP